VLDEFIMFMVTVDGTIGGGGGGSSAIVVKHPDLSKRARRMFDKFESGLHVVTVPRVGYCKPSPPSSLHESMAPNRADTIVNSGHWIIAFSIAFFVIGSYAVLFSAFFPLTGILVRSGV